MYAELSLVDTMYAELWLVDIMHTHLWLVRRRVCSPSAQSAASQLELVQKQDLSPDIIPRTDSGDTSRNYVIELQMIPRFSQSRRRPLLLVNDAQFCLRSLSGRHAFRSINKENSFVLVNNYTRERRSISPVLPVWLLLIAVAVQLTSCYSPWSSHCL